MKLEKVEVWANAKGELHLTCEDSRVKAVNEGKGINIRCKDHLSSTRVLLDALVAENEAANRRADMFLVDEEDVRPIDLETGRPINE